ncbi:MAG: TlpA family protein disulfide reductase [Oligoflexia bacterium]|nr:TlpA family protein disulfide reductase [Oligoflexia bacterium]
MTQNRAWLGLGLGLGLTVALTWIYFLEHGSQRGQEETGRVELARQAAPLFRLKDAAGKEHSLEGLKGNAVVLHFWASWCPPCIDEIPVFLRLAKRLEGRPVKLLAVSLDGTWKDAHKILPSRALPANVISVLDSNSAVPDEYGTYQFPETFLLSPQLEIITKWAGPQDWASEPIFKAIEKATRDATPAAPVRR